MGRNTRCALRTFLFVSATLYISGCAYGPSNTKSNGGTSLSATNNAQSGPLLATWWDSGQKGLRTVYGVLGAARQGTPSFADGSYSGGSICMRKGIGLLIQNSGTVLSVSLPDGSPAVIASNSNPRASIVFSPSCTTALVYASGAQTGLVVQGLLTSPTVASVNMSAGVFATAVADSGSVFTAIPKINGAASIQLLSSTTSLAQPVTTVASFGGMAFLPGADTALVADGVGNTITEVTSRSGVLSLTPLANASIGVSTPLAIAVSADGRMAAVVNRGDSSVLRLDLTGQTPAVKTICHCSPTRLEPLAGNFVFRINEPGAGTVWAFDGDSTEPRMLFLPSSDAAGNAKGVRL